MKRFEYFWQLIGFGKYQAKKKEIKEPRPNGFYWVKYSGGEAWTVAEWYGDHWSALNDSESLKDYNFDLIHEERIEPPNYHLSNVANAIEEQC